MSYIVQEKFNIYDLVPRPDRRNLIGIVEQEDYLAKLYEKYLQQQQFTVYHCPQPQDVEDFLAFLSPQVLLLNPESYGPTKLAAKVVKRVIGSFPELLVVTVSYDTAPEDLKLLMGAGIVSHINRKLSKPQDVAEVIRSVLGTV